MADTDPAGLGQLQPEDSTQPSRLDPGAALLVFKDWFKGDAEHSSTWRKNAKEDFEFIADCGGTEGGGQWTIEEIGILKNQNRQPIVFNRTLTVISAVAGMEINGRHEISFIPRNTQDTAVNEVLSAGSKWMADNCDGEDEESEAFQHMLICGMGWNEHRMDYEEDPKGLYEEEALDPLEMYWDRTAKKKNLSDTRRRWRVRKMPVSDAMDLLPGFTIDELDAKWAVGNEPNEPVKSLEERRVRDENTTGRYADRHEVTLVQVQWWEREIYYRVADPVTNQAIDLDEDKHALLKSRMEALGVPLISVRLKRKRFKQAFLGSKVLEMGQAPIPTMFSWTCITGQINHNKRTWFGLVRLMRDPQKWGNKWLSQILHILNSTAKGGIIAETDAFEDIRQAEQTYAKPEGITWAKRDALSNANGPKIIPKPGAGNATGYFELLPMAINAVRDVSGINLELLGQKDIAQPGVLEAHRKQAGMTVLAKMFDALRRARKDIGRIRLYFMQNFLADGRMMRITGPEGAKAVPLLKDKCLGEYDTIVDDTPTSPNQKEANWAVIAPLIAMFKDELAQNPELLGEVLDYSPLPTRLVEGIKAAIKTKASDPVGQQQQQLTVANALAEIARKQAAANKDQAAAGGIQATAMYDIAMAHNLLRKGDIDGLGQHLDHMLQAAKVDKEMAATDHLRAQTQGRDADTLATHVGTAVDALHPIPHHEDAFPKPQPQPARAA